MSEVTGNEEIVSRLVAIAGTGNMPHMLLCGPPGVGKTTSIHCLSSELLHECSEEVRKEAVFELNASDERGIEVVRQQIKQFATKKVNLPPNRQKVVILDEVDSMTPGAQQALRRIMEIYSSTTRFALACNNSSKIIEPIQSRCAILRYGRLTDSELLGRLMEVCEREGVKYSPDGLEAIIFSSEGDMRNALNCLQSTSAGFGFVSGENVWKVCDSPNPIYVEKIIMLCLRDAKLGSGSGDNGGASSTTLGDGLDEAQSHLEELLDKGYSPIDLIGTFFRVTKNLKINEGLQLDVCREIGICQMRILEGVSSRLQLFSLLSSISLLVNGQGLGSNIITRIDISC